MPMTDQQRTWLGVLMKRDPPDAAADPAAGDTATPKPGILADGAAFVEDALSNGGLLNQVKRGGRGSPPAEELDEGEGKNSDGTVRRKAGRGGQSRGGESKQSQDRDVDDAVRDFGLTEDERRRLHDEIGGRDLGRDKVREEAQAIRDGRKKPTTTETKPEESGAPETSEKSTPDTIIDGAEIVAGVALAVGLAAAPIPGVDVVVDTGALVVAAGAGLVIAGASLFKALTEDDKPPPEA